MVAFFVIGETMRTIILLSIAALLVACGGCAPPPTAQKVLDDFKAAGLPVENVTTPPRDPSAPLPNSYTERLTFTVPALGDKGGQVFVCETKQHCGALYAYFDGLKGLAGPYLYQSPNGLVVAQLNKGHDAATAAKYQAVIEGYK
jgi:hypothetical protein